MSTKTAFQEPQPIGWSRAEVQKFASDAAQKLGYKPGDDMEAVVEKKLGGRISVSDWDSSRDTGAIQVEGPKNFRVSLAAVTIRKESLV